MVNVSSDTPYLRLRLLFKACLIFLLFFGSNLYGQNDLLQLRQLRVKSIYLNNFVKEVQWPANAIKDTFRIAIVKDPKFANYFSGITTTKLHDGKNYPRKVISVDNLDDAKSFQMIFIGAESGFTADQLIGAIGKQPVLLVTENYEFGSTMINFIIINNKLQYEVNVLRIESNNLAPENELINRAIASENEAEFQRALRDLRRKLNLSESENVKKAEEIEKLNEEVLRIEKEKIKAQEDLDSIEASIRNQRRLAEELRAQVDSNATEILRKERELEDNDLKLTKQMVELEKAKKNFEELEDERNKTLQALENQKLFLTISVLVTLLIAVLLIVAYRSFVKQRKQASIINRQKEEAEIQRDEIQTQHIQLADKNKEITDSITYAKRIQDAMLPSLEVFHQLLPKSFVFYLPKDIVAGDFYWMERSNGKIIFAAADCTGHGVPGAIVSVICSNALNRSVREFKLDQPSEILNKTLEIVLDKFSSSDDEVKDGMDIALCAYEPKTHELEYAGANNPLWIIRKGKNEIEEYKANKQPIGKYLKHTPFKNHKVKLNPGDTIYMFSDGFADQFGGEMGKKFRTVHFKELLLSIQAKNMKEQQRAIEKAFFGWKGKLDQLDDICVIGFRA